VGSVVGGKMKMACGGNADFLNMIQEVFTLAKDIIRELVLCLAIVIGVSIAVILLIIFLIAPII